MGLFDGTALERPVLCDQCDQDVKTCGCPPPQNQEAEPRVEPAKQLLKIRIEKRKRGKLMTVIAGFRGPHNQRQDLLTELKDLCGAGGTLADGNIEVQGSHQSRIRQFLETRQYRIAK